MIDSSSRRRESSTLPSVPTTDTVVFIPAFNEEANLPAVLQELGPACPTWTCW